MKFEHLQRKPNKQRQEEAASTFPDHYAPMYGGDPDASDDILKDIQEVLARHDETMHELGRRGLEKTD